MTTDLRTDFSTREALVSYLHETFPETAARDPHVSPIRGGRKAAEAQLDQIDPLAYGRTRNHLAGKVTRLSPWLRHGVLSLREVRLLVLTEGYSAEKLINELAWRDYWQRVYVLIGEGIWQDRELYKTGFRAEEYARELPADLVGGTTGLVCMDSFVADLHATGWLHNHARMWMAAYVVHHRRVRWQAGAVWFLANLLDGDPASNNLSWQWVASTFSHKPYIFDRENLQRNTDGVYCERCPLAHGGCPFDQSYEALEAKLFPKKTTRDYADDDRRDSYQKDTRRKGRY